MRFLTQTKLDTYPRSVNKHTVVVALYYLACNETEELRRVKWKGLWEKQL
jgi:hypothetical protein